MSVQACRLGAGVLLLILSGCRVGAAIGAGLPTQFEIEVAVTPGKPAAPTEEVGLAWDGRECILRAARYAAGHEPVADKNVLPEAECRAAWNAARVVPGFKPRPTGRRVADFGRLTIALRWTPRTDQSLQQTAVSWEEEIANHATIQPLFQHLSRLVRENLEGVELHFF